MFKGLFDKIRLAASLGAKTNQQVWDQFVADGTYHRIALKIEANQKSSVGKWSNKIFKTATAKGIADSGFIASKAVHALVIMAAGAALIPASIMAAPAVGVYLAAGAGAIAAGTSFIGTGKLVGVFGAAIAASLALAVYSNTRNDGYSTCEKRLNLLIDAKNLSPDEKAVGVMDWLRGAKQVASESIREIFHMQPAEAQFFTPANKSLAHTL